MITYNHEAYIREAIESALRQHTNFNYEIIIGEDCSTDNTRDIVFQYAKIYPDTITVITSKRNVGATQNSIRTFKACQGKYIAFLNGDDYFFSPHKLQKQVDFLESHPDCGIVHSDYNEYAQKTNKLITRAHYRARKRIPVGYVFEDLLINNFIVTLTVCMRRELIFKIIDLKNVSRQHFLMGDYPAWLEAAAHTKIGYIDEALSTYRKLESSASHFPNPYKQLKFISSSYKVKFFYIKKYGCSQRVLDIILKNYFSQVLKLANHYQIPYLSKMAFTEWKYYRSRLKSRDFDQALYFLGSHHRLLRAFTKLYFLIKRLAKRKAFFQQDYL
jgi:glycosyltransferase involved in cell wall biosynthesis